MIGVILTSKVSNRVIKKSYTARQLLNFCDESDLVLDVSKCDCQPVGETNVVDCNCDDEWEDYYLIFED